MKQQKSTSNSYNLFVDVILKQNVVNLFLITQSVRFTPLRWGSKNMLVKWKKTVLSGQPSWEFADQMAAMAFNQTFIKWFNWFRRDYNSHA